MTYRPGFSLIELLVVISILAVVVALLLPGITKARIMAQNLACQSSLRQIGLAPEAYASDANGISCPVVAPETVPYTGTWHVLIMPYFNAVLTQPGESGGGVFYGCRAWRGRRLASGQLARTGFGYGMNPFPGLPENPNDSNFRDNWGPASQFFPQDSISYPSNRIMVADGNDWHLIGLRYHKVVYKYIDAAWQGQGQRHAQRINAVFFDGHVESVAYLRAWAAIDNPAASQNP